jgi:HK97 family phage portal protein
VPTIKQRFTAAIKAVRFGGQPYAISWGGYGVPYWSNQWGRNVNYAQAVGDPLDNSIVAAACGWIGRTFPEAPIRIVRETKNGNEPVVAHPLALKLRRPNPFDGPSTLWTPAMLSWILDGNVYFQIERTNGGDVLSLWYRPHWQMEPRWNSPYSFVDYYDYTVDGKTEKIDARDVIHLRNGKDPRNQRKGLSQIKSVIREIYSDNKATEYSAAMVTNYGTPNMIISPSNPDQSFTEAQAATIKQNTIEKTTGDRRGEPIIFLDPVKVDIPAFSPRDMNVRESQFTPEERISAVIGIPAVVVGLGAGLNRSTYSNTEQMKAAAYDSYLIPTQRSIAEQLTIQLLPNFSTDAAEMVDFDYANVRALQEDADKLAERSAKVFTSGIIDRARAKTLIGIEPDTDDEGIYLLPRGASFSDGQIAEPIAPQTVPVNTEPGATNVPTNGHAVAPVPAAT